MNNEQNLQSQVASWNKQAATGKITYHELEIRIRQASEALNEKFAAERNWEEYDAQRGFLILKDVSDQQWRLFADGTWRRQTPEGWRIGKPKLTLPPTPLPPSPPPPAPPSSLKSVLGPALIVAAAAIAMALLVGGGLLVVSIARLTTPTPTHPPSPTTLIARAEMPTDTPTPTPTAKPETMLPADTPLPTATPTLTPGVTPPTPTPSVTLPIPSPSPTATNMPLPPPPVTDTPAPPLTPYPYGVIAYAAFDEVTDTYNLYLRVWPDLKVIQTILKAGQPAAQRNGRLLAYRSWDAERQGILKMDLQSQEVLPGAIGPLEAMHPAWSPSGRKIVFTANNETDRKWRLCVSGWVLPIEGSLEGPAWVNDDRLAFHGCVTEGCGLFTANADGRNLQRLTAGHDLNPVPSPDGERVAFISDRDGNWDIYLIAADGSQTKPTRLTTNPAIDALPAWSPDGHWIAFASYRGGRWAMWMMSAEGGEAQHLFDMEGSPDGFVIDGTPSQAGWFQEQVSWFR